MELIAGPRRSGRTTLLIKKSAEAGYPIAVKDWSQARRLIEMAHEMNLEIPEPITFNHISKAIAKGGVLIDEAQDLIEHLLVLQHGLVKNMTNVTVTVNAEQILEAISQE